MSKKKLFYSFMTVVALSVGSIIFFNRTSVVAPTLATKPAATTSKSATTSPAAITFDKTQFSLTNPNSQWVVVNKTRPLQPTTYAPTDLVAVGGQQLHAAAAQALTKLLAGAKAAGLTITAASGYRSYATQVSVYNSEVQAYGQVVADSESARPGTSEHQTGWAVDLAGGGCSIEDCFGTTAQGKWIVAHAYEYGFILRYPKDKEAVTGYRYESWHIRYVGTALSQEMHAQNIETLEEFFGLPAAPAYLS